MKVKRNDLLLVVASVVLCLGTCLVAKFTTPPFELNAVSYQTATTTITKEQTIIQTTAVSTETQTNITSFDLNTVTKEELLTIQGIGEVIAERILTYREQNGGFDTVEELLNISGIGEKRLENWRENFYIA